MLLPSIFSLIANPRIAHAQLAPDIASAVSACNITAGAGLIPFICFDLSGGANMVGSNVLGGGPTGQLDFLSVAGYSKQGLPGTMVPNSSATGSFVDASLGLRLSLGQCAVARHQDARERGGDGQHERHADSGAVEQ